jgi:hypothetical protein
VGSLATAALLAFLLAARCHEFAAALSGPAVWVLAATALLQIVALLARSESWHLTIQAAGGTFDRRILYRALSFPVLGSVIDGQLGSRRGSPRCAGRRQPSVHGCRRYRRGVPDPRRRGTLAALTSFTLVAPMRLPSWLPLVGLAVIATASAGLRHLALRKGRELWRGLAVLRSLRGGSRADRGGNARAASVGPSVGAAAAVLILGSDGGSGGRWAHDGYGHRRRTVLRRVGRRRPALVRKPPRQVAARPRPSRAGQRYAP